MFQEMKFEDAIKKYLKGRKVLALTDLSIDKDHQDYELEPLEDVLARMQYLVDIPAVENPDFKEIVGRVENPEKMIPPQEETAAALMETERSSARELRGYTGFLHIRCEHCGKTKTFCTKHQLSHYSCKECGEKTDLKDLKLAFINCECSSRLKYFTNETADLIELNCINCGMPVALKYNAKKNLYETIRS